MTAAPSAQIASFTASTQRSPYGGDVTLHWTVTNPGSVTITADPAAPGRGHHVLEDPMAASGMVTVNPIADNDLHAHGDVGWDECGY